MKPQDAYKDLVSRMKEIAILNSTGGVLDWDQEAYLPLEGDDFRAEQLAQIDKLTHQWFTDPVINELISTVEDSDMVSDRLSETAVNIREWRRLYDWEVKLPSEFVQEFARTTSKASRIWSEARKKNDFKSFQPILEKIVNLCIEKADYIGYTTERYDALLDEFEPGAKTSEIETAFKNLRIDLVELIGKIKDSPNKPDIGILKRPYDVAKQKYFAESIAAAIGYDFKQGRVDLAAHPSCNGLGPNDTRILTRYYPEDLAEGLTGIIHETGHALYDMSRSDKKHWGTPVGETASLGIHESQSRIWENIVGRSREFWSYFFPQMQRIFREETDGISLNQFYGAMNSVSPSYIRVEADEATYNLHIMLRFELERAILGGEIKVSDIPGEWNKRFKEYFGIEVDKDSNGCLQDIHWAHGIFGYFPTYALGNLYAAQFWAKAQNDLPDLTGDFAVGKFSRLLDWLRDNIHNEGFRYYSPELCKKVTGQPLSQKPLLDYLYNKYSDIYGISKS